MVRDALIHQLEARLEANPKSLVFAWLADLYLQEGRIPDAIRVCLEGIKHHPGYVTGHFVLAKAYLANDEIENAEGELKNVLSHDKEYLPAHLLLGDIMNKMGWENKAANHYRQILAIDPAEETARSRLAAMNESITWDFSVLQEETVEAPFEPKTAAGPEKEAWVDDIREVFPETIERPPSPRTPEPQVKPAFPETLDDLDAFLEEAFEKPIPEKPEFFAVKDSQAPEGVPSASEEAEKITDAFLGGLEIETESPSRTAPFEEITKPISPTQGETQITGQDFEEIFAKPLSESPSLSPEPDVSSLTWDLNEGLTPLSPDEEKELFGTVSEVNSVGLPALDLEVPLFESEPPASLSPPSPSPIEEVQEEETEPAVWEIPDSTLEALDSLPQETMPPQAKEKEGLQVSETPDARKIERPETPAQSGIGKPSSPPPPPEPTKRPATPPPESPPPPKEAGPPPRRIITSTLGEIYAAQGQYDKAVAVYEELLSQNPDNPKYKEKLEEYRKKLKEQAG